MNSLSDVSCSSIQLSLDAVTVSSKRIARWIPLVVAGFAPIHLDTAGAWPIIRTTVHPSRLMIIRELGPSFFAKSPELLSGNLSEQQIVSLKTLDPTLNIGSDPLAKTAAIRRLFEDVHTYKQQRGLSAGSGLADAGLWMRLDQDGRERDGMLRVRTQLQSDQAIAMLRQDTATGQIWRLSFIDKPDVFFDSLHDLKDELNSDSGTRPILFTAGIGSDHINGIISSLMIGKNGERRAVPIVLTGTPDENLGLLKKQRLALDAESIAAGSMLHFREGGNVYHDISVGGPSKWTLRIWAPSTERLDRAIDLVKRFAASAAVGALELLTLPEFAARLRDFLFDHGINLNEVGIEMRGDEMKARQWASLSPIAV